MSGMPPLRAITKLCCAARLFFRERRIAAGKERPSEHFSCATCGNAYVHDGLGWHRVSAVEELRSMVAEDPRGTLTEER